MVLATNLLDISQFGCFAYSLYLVVRDAIEISIESIVDDIKRIVMHFKKRPQATVNLAQVQQNLKMSTFKLKQDMPMNVGIQHSICFIGFFLNKAALGVCIRNSLQNSHWKTTEETIEILKPFHEATVTISSVKSVTLSKTGLLIKLLKDKMTSLDIEDLINEAKLVMSVIQHSLDKKIKLATMTQFRKQC